MATAKKTQKQKYTKKEIDEGKGLAWLSYVGPLVLIPFLAYKNNKYIQDHAKQGMNLFIIELIIGVGGSILAACTLLLFFLGILVAFIVNAVGVILLVLSIMGIVYSVQGEYKDLPLIDKIKIIK